MGSNGTLTELEKTILNKIHNHINKNEKVGIDKVANECFVSKSAVIKLSKKLGYSGYSEMYYTILASVNNTIKMNFFNSSTDNIDSVHINEHTKSDVNMLVELLKEYRNQKIILDSLGICDSAKEYYVQKLLIFGFDVVSSYHYEAFRNSRPGLYFFFSHSGYRAEIIEKVSEAIRNQFKVVAFTSNVESPLAKMAHFAIEVEGIKSDSESYLPDFFTANLIILLELILSEYSKKYLSKVET